MPRFLEVLRSGRVLLMDGAMGTELRRAGLPDAACGEAWNLTEPGRVRAIHRAYVEAGACCLLTNTFQANPAALSRHGLTDHLGAIIRAAVGHARAAGPGCFVLADIGPGLESSPGDRAAEALAAFRGVDALLLETCSDVPDELLCTCGRLFQEHGVPVLLSLTYRRTAAGDLSTHGGAAPEDGARRARRSGVAALGVNCGRDIDMAEVIAIIRRYRRETDLPLFARPNAGTPVRGTEGWVYPRTPAALAARLPELLAAGATLVGGCCGTTPEHIAAFRPILDAWNARPDAGG
jgi:5-methyltetrahydrofolate--homocysteine methyltransferase